MAAVTEGNSPRNRAFFFFTDYANTMAKGRKVCIPAYVNSLVWAGLYAGVALPAHVRFDVVSTAKGFIDVHDVRRADIDALPTTIATGHIDESWHFYSLFVGKLVNLLLVVVRRFTLDAKTHIHGRVFE